MITLVRRVVRSFYASGNYIEWAQLWFLPYLFHLNMFVGVLFHLGYGRIKWLWLRCIFLEAMLWTGVAFLPIYYMKDATIVGRTVVLESLPASADLLLITGTYILLGYEIRHRVPERFIGSLWTLGVSGLLLSTLNLIFPDDIDLFFRTYDSVFINILEALSGSFFLLSLSSRIARNRNWFSAILTYFGQITIILLIFHQPTGTLTFGRVIILFDNIYLAGLISFLASLGLPVLIHQLILKENPRLGDWFGLRPVE